MYKTFLNYILKMNLEEYVFSFEDKSNRFQNAICLSNILSDEKTFLPKDIVDCEQHISV